MSLYAERRCSAAVTLPDPWMLAQCALDAAEASATEGARSEAAEVTR